MQTAKVLPTIRDEKVTRKRISNRWKRALVLSVAFVLLVSLAVSSAHVSFASSSQGVTTTTTSYATTSSSQGLLSCGSLLSTCYPLQSSVVQWSVQFGSSAQSSYFTMKVQASGSNAAVIPKSVQVSAWMTYNGAKYWSSTFTLRYILLQTSASTSFHVPFVSGGEYVFYATFTSSGKVVAQQIVDPKIEPEFSSN
jgi:hypothetical protein